MFESEHLHQSQFKGRIISLSKYNDIGWGEWKRNEHVSESDATRVAACATQFEPGRRTFLGSRDEENMVWEADRQSKSKMELSSGEDDEEVRCKWTPCIHVCSSVVQRRADEQRMWKNFHSLLMQTRALGNNC